MKLQRGERRLVVAIACAGVILGIGIGAFKIYEKREQARLEELDKIEQKKYDQTFSIGEEVVLDSETDEVLMPSGWPYEAAFSWDGRMDVKIDRARLYSSSNALLTDLDQAARWVQYFELDRLGWARQNGQDERYILLDVTVHNVSAEPNGLSQTGHPWFNIGFVNLSVQQSDMEIEAFSGVPDEGDIELVGYRFDLPVGETASYQLVYSLNNEAELDEMFCYMGVAYAPHKYRVELDGVEVMPDGA